MAGPGWARLAWFIGLGFAVFAAPLSHALAVLRVVPSAAFPYPLYVLHIVLLGALALFDPLLFVRHGHAVFSSGWFRRRC
jgi:hypothetical protein